MTTRRGCCGSPATPARLGFAIAPDTDELARQALTSGALETVSGPRLGAELSLLSAEADPIAGFAVLRSLGIDRALAPGFGLADPDLATRALALSPDDADREALLLGLAGRGLQAGALRAFLQRLGVSAPRREAALAVRDGDRLAAALGAAARPSQVAAAVTGAPVEAIAAAGAIGGPDAAGRAHAWLTAERHTALSIAGTDLIAAGIAEGPAIGRGLTAARAAKLDGRAPTRAWELSEALRAARGVG